MINFQRPAFQDVNNFCNRDFVCETIVSVQSCKSVSHSSLAIFRSHVDMLYFPFRFFIVFVAGNAGNY